MAVLTTRAIDLKQPVRLRALTRGVVGKETRARLMRALRARVEELFHQPSDAVTFLENERARARTHAPKRRRVNNRWKRARDGMNTRTTVIDPVVAALKPTAYHPIGAGVLEVANVPNILVTRDDDVTHALDTFNDDADDSLDDDDDTDDTDDDERATKKTK